VIAASNRNLELEVERGKFRQDLYFRLAVVPIWLPPLRARRSDIGLLARQLLVRICKDHGSGKALELTETMLQGLAGHDWPGNVRELRNVLERAALLAYAQGSPQLSAAPLALTSLGPPAPRPVASISPPEREPAFDPEASYGATRAQWEADFERRYVSWLLARHDGNISAAARAAEMDRKHLHKLAQKHGLK
jgi:transcriptional regulator with GAF, ATPase, and Fis domain